jgi:hypothetical protein
MKMVYMLFAYDKTLQKIKRVHEEKSLLEIIDTGMVSDNTYGTEIRKVNVSRGNRMGNNAFLEDRQVASNTFRNYFTDELFL